MEGQVNKESARPCIKKPDF